jgi:hypothetical protein
MKKEIIKICTSKRIIKICTSRCDQVPTIRA